MINSKQRSYLRKLANGIKPIFQVGKGGIDENVINQFDEALEAKELVKASVLRNCESDSRQVCEYIADMTGAQVVQIIGSRFVLYRESLENKRIELP